MGVQAHAIGPHGEEVWGVAGECFPGQSMETTTLHNVYCGLRPVTIATLVNVLASIEFDREMPLSAMGIPELSHLECSLSQLLNHSAGVLRPDATEYRMCPLQLRDKSLPAPHVESIGDHPKAGYSDFAAWLVVKVLVEGLTQRDFYDLRQVTVDAMNLEFPPWWPSSADDFQKRLESVGVFWSFSSVPPKPILLDRLASNAADTELTGGYVSAQGLAGIYDALGQSLNRTREDFLSPDMLVDVLSQRRGRVYDETLRKPCDFAGGFMVDLVDHGFGDLPGSRSFGHSGFGGMSFGFCDPDAQVSVAAMVNGLPPDGAYETEVRAGLSAAAFAELELLR